MYYLSGLWRGSTATDTALAPSLQYQNLSASKVKTIEQKLQKAGFLEVCRLKDLKNLRKYLRIRNRTGDSTFTKIAELIEKKKDSPPYLGDSVFKKIPGRPQEIQMINRGIPAERPEEKKEEDNTKFNGVGLSLKVMKQIIKEQGQNYKEIFIDLADDDLLQLIAEKCANNLTSFTYIDGTDLWPFVTNKGLEQVGKLMQLNTLIITATMEVSGQDFNQMLSKPSFANNIKHLGIQLLDYGVTPWQSPIKDYKNLKTLTISGENQSYSSSLVEILNSGSFKSTLEDLRLEAVIEISDDIIKSLSAYTELKMCTLIPQAPLPDGSGTWNVKLCNFQQFLGEHPLDQLYLGENVPVSTEMMQSILCTVSLKNLIVWDCGRVQEGGFNTLDKMISLTTLKLDKLNQPIQFLACDGFGESQLKQLAVLKINDLELNFASSDPLSLNGFNKFAEKGQNLTSTLKSLCLSGINCEDIQSEEYEFLGQFPLTALQVRNCRYFNDTTLASLAKTDLAKTLESLEIRDNALTVQSFELFSQFSNLSTLGLIDCNGMPYAEAAIALVSNEFIRKNIKGLALVNFRIPYDLMSKLIKFPNLKILIMYNNDVLTDDQYWELVKTTPADFIWENVSGQTDGAFDQLLQAQSLRSK